MAVPESTCYLGTVVIILWISNLSNFSPVASTHDKHVFSFYSDHRPCHGFEEVLRRYREIVPHLNLSGFGELPFPIFYEISFCQLLIARTVPFALYICKFKLIFILTFLVK